MLFYYLFWMFTCFSIHFYIIFGTNLLTGGPSHIAVLLPVQYFEEKEYQPESKQNETFGRVIFGTEAIQGTWSARQGTTRRARGRGPRLPPPPRRALHPRGLPVVPPMCSFLLYIYTYVPPNDQIRSQNPNSTAATFCIHDIPSWGLFQSSARGGIDHGGLLHQHHRPSMNCGFMIKFIYEQYLYLFWILLCMIGLSLKVFLNYQFVLAY